MKIKIFFIIGVLLGVTSIVLGISAPRNNKWSTVDSRGNGAYVSSTGAIVCSGSLTSAGFSNSGGKTQWSYTVATDSITVTATSNTVIDCTKNGVMTVTLPTASGNAGLIYVIKKSGTAAAITIVTNSTETVDGVDDPSYVDAQYDFLWIISDGTNWKVIGRYIQ